MGQISQTTPGASSGPLIVDHCLLTCPCECWRSEVTSPGGRQGAGMTLEGQKWDPPDSLPPCAASPVDGLGSLLPRKHGFIQATDQLLSPLGSRHTGQAWKAWKALFPELTVTNKRTSSGHLTGLQSLISSTRIIPNRDKTSGISHQKI